MNKRAFSRRSVSWMSLATSLAFFASPALAQANASDGTSTLDSDIIVTARRVDERLQDVPISITVFNQEQLNNANISSARELATLTPSLSTNSRFGSDYASFAIRGFTQESRTTASVAVYFADVVAPRGGGQSSGGDGAGPGNMFDLQNIQVLKGPQGTLFGRNTTGGAVLLIPRRPTGDFEGYVEGSVGNYDMRRVQAVVNVPLADTFSVRAGVDWQKRDGWQKNYSGAGPKDFGDLDYVAARVSVLGELTPNLENYTIASYSRSTPNGTLPKVTDCFSNFAPLGPLTCQQIAREQELGSKYVSNWLPNARQKSETWQVINTTTWQASDNLTVKNIASYAEVRQDQATDLFGIGIPLGETITIGATYPVPSQFQGGYTGSSTVISPPGLLSTEQSTFTEELQLLGKALNGRLTWQAGAYYESSRPLGFAGTQSMNNMLCQNVEQFEAFTCTNILPLITGNSRYSGQMNYQVVKTEFRNVGLYVQATYDLADNLKFTGGFRYTWDKVTSESMLLGFNFPAPSYNVPVGTCVNPALTYQTSPGDCREFFEKKSSAPTWMLGLDYKPTNDVLLYAKYSRGYRQGSTNPFSAIGFQTFEPEKVDTYEAGIKSSFRGSIPGTFNLTAFYNDFTDQQLQVAFTDTNTLPPFLSPNTGIVNAGKSRIYGAEVEASVNPFDGLTLRASYAYLNTKLREFTPPDLSTQPPGYYDQIGSTPTVGSRLPLTPTHKLVLDGQYRLPVDGGIGRITIGGTYIHTSSIFHADIPASLEALLDSPVRTSILANSDDPTISPGYSLVNFNANWDGILGSALDAQFFITNAFDKGYYSERSLSISRGFVIRYQGQPRMYGMRLRYNF